MGSRREVPRLTLEKRIMPAERWRYETLVMAGMAAAHNTLACFVGNGERGVFIGHPHQSHVLYPESFYLIGLRQARVEWRNHFISKACDSRGGNGATA